MDPEVSVCIVSWNTADLLRRCLQSIAETTRGVTFEIIVVDNASADRSPDMLEREFPHVRLIRSTENLGFVRGNNLAFSKAKGKYILALNPDTELLSNAIFELYDCISRNSSIGVVGGCLTDPTGRIQYTCACTYPTPWNELTELLGLNRILPRAPLFSSREIDWWDHAESRDVDCLSGACMMSPRELIHTLGGFDSRIFMYAEDVDYCYRVKKSGRRVYYLSQASILHWEGASTSMRKESFAAVRQRAANAYFLRKHHGRVDAFLYRAAVFSGCVSRLVFILISSLPELMLKSPRRWRRIGRLRKNLELLRWSLHLADSTMVQT